MKNTTLITLLALLSLIVIALSGCKKKHTHKFHKGQLVEVLLDGRKGQVVGLYTYHGTVMVRLVSHSSSTALLGGSVDESPYTIIDFAEYEIKNLE